MHLPVVLRTSLAYAALVFATGFALGTLRVFLVVPRLGVRWAELLEMPLMLVASYLWARFALRRWGPFDASRRVLIGFLALVVMLLAEVGFVLAQGFGLLEYVASRDPVSGGAYLLSLAIFAAMPVLLGQGGGRRRRDRSGDTTCL